MLFRLGSLAATLTAILAIAAPASAAERIEAGRASATVTADPWSIEFRQGGGQPLVSDSGLELVTAAGRVRAVRARSLTEDGEAIVAEVEMEDGSTLAVRVAPAGTGAFSVALSAPGSVRATAARFAADADERFYGFGERSDFVERRGHEAENYVSDGPVRPEDRDYTRPFVPPWATRDRDDSTYYPVPWLLSSRGWGVLVDEDATSRPTARATTRSRARPRTRRSPTSSSRAGWSSARCCP